MEEIDVLGVYCRVCGIKCKKAVKIFSGKGRGMGLREKILKCLLLSVKKSDQLPTRVCYTCIDRLDDFSQFNLLSRQAQVKLRTLVKLNGIHVKEEKNSELISTWKALLAMQGRQNEKGSKGRKRKRKTEIRLDVSSDSDTSSSDSESAFEARHAILPPMGPPLHDSFSLPDSSMHYRNPSTSTSTISNFNESKQERNFSSSTSMASVSDPPKEEISLPGPVESPQRTPVSRDMMGPYKQQTSTIDNSFISAPPSQPFHIPTQIPNSLFLFQGNTTQPPNVGISPLYVVNLAYNASETVSNISQVGNNCDISERTGVETSSGQSFSSYLPPTSSHLTVLTSEQNNNVYTPPAVSLTSEPNTLASGMSSSDVPPPLLPIDRLPRIQVPGGVSKESHQLEINLETAQQNVKDTRYLGQSSANYTDTSCTPCDIQLSTQRETLKNSLNIGSDDMNLPSPNSSVASLRAQSAGCRLNSQFSDVSDVEESLREIVEISNDLPCAGPSSLSTLQGVSKEVPSAGSVPKVTFKVKSLDSQPCDRTRPLANIIVPPKKTKYNPTSCSTTCSTVESKGDATIGSRSYSPCLSDNAESIVAPSSKEQAASENCENVRKGESSEEDFTLAMTESNEDENLLIVSDSDSDTITLEVVHEDPTSKANNSMQELNPVTADTGLDTIPIEVVYEDPTSEAKNSMRESNLVTAENEAGELFPKSDPSVVNRVQRNLFTSPETSSLDRKQAEVPATHIPFKMNVQASDTAKEKDIILLKENLSKKGLFIPQPDTSRSVLSPQKLKSPQKTGKFKCELCSKYSPTFFNHITEAMYHHQQRHRGVRCLFSCSKCSYVSEQLQDLRQHILASCTLDKTPRKKKPDESPVPKIKQEDSQDYEQALLNLKNALRSVSMPRFRRLLTTCRSVLSPDASGKEAGGDSSFSNSSPSTSNINKETIGRSNNQTPDWKCSFCRSSFKSKAYLETHSKDCPFPDKERSLTDSPPAKKFKPVDLFISSKFTREGSYYSCIECGKNFPSAFKAKMHATRSKSCRGNDQNKLMRNAESKWKTPDFNLPSTFRAASDGKSPGMQASTSQSVMVKASSLSTYGSGMVFDIPAIKVEREDTDEELNLESHKSSQPCVDINISKDKERRGNKTKKLRSTSSKKKLKRVGKEKNSGEVESQPASFYYQPTKITQPEDMGVDLEKVKVEKPEDTSTNCADSGKILNSKDWNSGSRKEPKAGAEVQKNCSNKKTKTLSKESSTNSEVDFNHSVLRQYSSPFQVLRPEDPKEPLLVSNLKPKNTSKKVPRTTSLLDETDWSHKPDSIVKPTSSVPKASPAQSVKQSTQVAHSPSKATRKSFRPILPKPTFMNFNQNDNNVQHQPSENILGTPSSPSEPKSLVQAPKEKVNCEKSVKTPETSSPPTPPKPTPESVEASPTKLWLKNAEKYCSNKTHSNDPNRGLVLKVPLVKLTRLRLLNNGEVDVSRIEFGNGKPSSSSVTSDKNDRLSGGGKDKGSDEGVTCKEEVSEGSAGEEESIFGC